MNDLQKINKIVKIQKKREEKDGRRKQKEERRQNLAFAKYLLKLSKKNKLLDKLIN